MSNGSQRNLASKISSPLAAFLAFFVGTQAIAAFSITNVPENLRIYVVIFMISFAFLVFFCFLMFLIFRPQILYPPSEYGASAGDYVEKIVQGSERLKDAGYLEDPGFKHAVFSLLDTIQQEQDALGLNNDDQSEFIANIGLDLRDYDSKSGADQMILLRRGLRQNFFFPISDGSVSRAEVGARFPLFYSSTSDGIPFKQETSGFYNFSFLYLTGNIEEREFSELSEYHRYVSSRKSLAVSIQIRFFSEGDVVFVCSGYEIVLSQYLIRQTLFDYCRDKTGLDPDLVYVIGRNGDIFGRLSDFNVDGSQE